jgi:hypothetical protein
VLIICPGVHAADWTESCLRGLFPQGVPPCLVNQGLPYTAHGVLNQLAQAQVTQDEPLIWLSFSAGVVAASTAASYWHHQGGTVCALIALDGWGVPLAADFPCYRLSHDHFTHWSSGILGSGSQNFYADPPVPHEQLWQQPQQVQGWQVSATQRQATTAATFIRQILRRYGYMEGQ